MKPLSNLCIDDGLDSVHCAPSFRLRVGKCF